MNKITKNILNGLLYITLVLLVFYLGIRIILFLFPFVLAYVFFLLTRPIYTFLTDKIHLKSKISNAISITIFYSILFGVFIYLIYLVTVQIYGLALKMPSIIEKIKEAYQYLLVQNVIKLPDYALVLLNKLFNTSVEYSSKFAIGVLNVSKETISKFPVYIVNLIIIIIATFLMGDNKSKIIEVANKQLPDVWIEKIVLIKTRVVDMFFGYMRAQLTIILICFFEVLTSFFLIDKFVYSFQYVVLGSIIVAFVDALPILGSGAILIPAVITSFVIGEKGLAICLLITYLSVTLTRQFLEPKLVSSNIGANPLLNLISMYVGFKLFGVLGFLLGPMLTTVMSILFSEEIEYGFFKFILENKEEKDEEIN